MGYLAVYMVFFMMIVIVFRVYHLGSTLSRVVGIGYGVSLILLSALFIGSLEIVYTDLSMNFNQDLVIIERYIALSQNIVAFSFAVLGAGIVHRSIFMKS